MKKIIEFSKKLVETKLFNHVVFLLILFSTIIIGFETYPNVYKKYHVVLYTLDKAIIIFFCIEILFRLLAEGKKTWLFFSDLWNVFDFIIVSICLIPLDDTHYFAVFRILRVLRVFKMIKFLPKLKLLIVALIKSIPSMGYVIMLIGLLFYVYAIIGVFLFGSINSFHFGNLHYALITLFKVLTLEGWVDIMNSLALKETNGQMEIISYVPFIYFASFIIIGAMIIMNLFIGVIMNSMEESRKELINELNKINEKDSEELYRHILTRLTELNNEIKSLKEKKQLY